MPHLALVTPTFYPEAIGTPHYATDIALWFSQHGWRVTVLTGQPYYPRYKLFDGYSVTRRRDKLGPIEILRMRTIVPKPGSAVWRLATDANFLARGISASRRISADAVLSVSPATPWAVIVGAAVARSGRHIALVHDLQSGLAASLRTGSILSRVLAYSERHSLGRSDHILALTPEMKEGIEQLRVRRAVSVLPLWSTVAPSQTPEAFCDSSTVQYSGNFGEKQGLVQLVRFAKELQSLNPAITLLLRGTGPQFDALIKTIELEGLTNVRTAQPVSNDQLADALTASPTHLVFQTPGSGRHVMPSKVINALAVGSSVIAMTETGTAIDRMAESIMGLTVVQNGDYSAMALAVERSLQAHDEIQRAAISSAAQGIFSRDVLLSRLADHLQPAS